MPGRLTGVLCSCSYYLKVELEVPLDLLVFRQPTETQTAFFVVVVTATAASHDATLGPLACSRL